MCIIFKKLEGGLSNSIFYIQFFDYKYVIKIQKENNDIFLDKDRYNKVLNLLCQNYIYYNKKVLVENYIDGRNLELFDFNHDWVIDKIINKIENIHNIKTDSIEKIPVFDKYYLKWLKYIDDNNYYNPIIKYIKFKMIEYNKIKLNYIDDLCLSHNDIHRLNILVDINCETLEFIDYEYAGYNYRLYDIANFLTEVRYKYYDKDLDKIDIIELDQNIHDKIVNKYFDTIKDNKFTLKDIIFHQILVSIFWTLWAFVKFIISKDKIYLTIAEKKFTDLKYSENKYFKS